MNQEVERMGVIADYWNGPCHIIVHDDCIKPPEEVKQIVRRVSQIVYQEEFRKHMQEKQGKQRKAAAQQ